MLIDKEYKSSFFIIPESGIALEALWKDIKIKAGNLINDIKVEKKRYIGKEIEVIKIIPSSPDNITSIIKKIKKLKGIKKILEDDIRYSNQYLLDRGVTPCRWHKVKGEEISVPAGIDVQKSYIFKGFPILSDRMDHPDLRILSFSIICFSPIGTANPEINPVIVLSASTSDGKSYQFIANDSGDSPDDRPIIEGFVKLVERFSPHILVGFGSNTRDLHYLLKRAEVHNLSLSIDRMKGEPHTSLYGHMSVTGRAHVDLHDLAEDIQEIKLKRLKEMGEFLGLKEATSPWIEDHDIYSYWIDARKRQELIESSKRDAILILKISSLMLNYAMELSSLVGIPLDHVCTAAVGFRVEAYLMKQARIYNEIIPKRMERPYIPYTGGIVIPPKPGIHENIAVLDFRSMYPNLMILYNISPDTYVKNPEEGMEYYEAPEVGHRFRKEPPGFYKKALTELIRVRQTVQQYMRKIKPEEKIYPILDARQKAIKIITNACYGYTGWIGARWYMKQVAEATTAWGRKTISETLRMAEEASIDVIYGDTDSIFIYYEPRKVESLIKKIEQTLGLEVRPDKIYKNILFTEAKKRYAGILEDGTIDIVGMEVVRGDWATIARKIQEGVLKKILKEKSADRAVKFVKEKIRDLKEGRIPYKDLVIWKTLTKHIHKYGANAPHVEAAKRLEHEGYRLRPGDKIGYVIIRGEGKLYTRARPYTVCAPENIDIDYYIHNQILPPAIRVLQGFNVDEEKILS